MPVIQDWITNPIEAVEGIFEQHKTQGDWEEKVSDFFKSKLENESVWKQIPSLNDTPSHELLDNQLVKFRGMVQDMFDVEYYLGLYEVKDAKCGATRLRFGRYKDLATCGPHEEILLDSPQNQHQERHNYYCISVPAENSWVKENLGKHNSSPQPSTSQQRRMKRGIDVEEAMEEDTSVASQKGEAASVVMSIEVSGSQLGVDSKKTRTRERHPEPQNGERQSPTVDLNFPLPDMVGKACLVRVYDSSLALSLNDVVEIVGVVSIDPTLAQFPDKSQEHNLLGVEMDTEEEEVHSPPPSLVPRLHAVDIRKLKHGHPDLPQDLKSSGLNDSTEDILREAENVRQELLAVLTQAFLGDSLAAEYFLCHLVSNIYLRTEVLALGKFSVNFHHIPLGADYSKKFYWLLQALCTKSHYVPMSLDTMNKSIFIPKKDYNANRLVSGVLQLSEHTHLVLDETELTPGQLDSNGVLNMTALGNVINWQKVDYDFVFHKMEYQCNIPVIILSEGKSLLPSDVEVPMCPVESNTEKVEEMFASIQNYLTPSLLIKIRKFVTVARFLDYKLSDELQKLVQEDFVQLRQQDRRKMTADDLHTVLVLARLLCLSHGKSVLTMEVWEKAKRLEEERKGRVAALSSRT